MLSMKSTQHACTEHYKEEQVLFLTEPSFFLSNFVSSMKKLQQNKML